jgi:DNA-binding NarL/FixJ family response regulator
VDVNRARTLLVSVNDVFTDRLVEWVSRGSQIGLVGRAYTGVQALDQLRSQPADLVLADISLPDMSGLELARRIKARPGSPLVILLSFHDSQTARAEALAAGADGFVAKSETTDCLIPLVGDLLRRRNQTNDREMVPGIPKMRGKPSDLSE